MHSNRHWVASRAALLLTAITSAALLLNANVTAASPTIASVYPPAGIVTNLTQITVTFSEAVTGVNATDLLVNGQPASLLTGSSNLYSFGFSQPPYGAVQITWATNNGITDLEFPPNAFDATQPGATWQYTLVDKTPPTVENLIPAAGDTVVSLNQIEVVFSEPVTNVDASDLLINGNPATDLSFGVPGQYFFTFPQPPTGAVLVTWAPGHGIQDLAAVPNSFAGGFWTYTLDPHMAFFDVRINEFLADNQNGIRDEDATHQDWLELYNASSIAVDLSGWYLTDDPLNLTKWRIPNGVELASSGYLLVWASQKDRTNLFALHTNFKLNKGGGYLGLVLPDGTNVVSSFSPSYPPQRADVSYGCDRLDPNIVGYFNTPTPGAPNATDRLGGFATDVIYSRPSGTFVTPFNLTLYTRSTNTVIRYVLITNYTQASVSVTNVPTTNSPIYTNPIPIAITTQVRARTFAPGLLPGTPVTESFIQISPNVLNFSSDGSLCIVHALGAGSVGASAQTGIIMLFDNGASGTNRSSLTNSPQVATRMGFHIRGSSTLNQAKSNYKVEYWDEYNQDIKLPFLDMPDESDWVLYGIDGFDPGLMHNAIFHWLGRQIGQPASRTHFVEVFSKVGNGPITTNDYFGLYLAEESPKISKVRLDLAPLELQDTNPPAVTGGYLMRIDRTGTGWNFQPPSVPLQPPQTNAFGNVIRSTPAPINIDDPKIFTSSTDPRLLTQANYARTYIMAFLNNLATVNYTNPATGYAQYLDPDQWADHLIANILCFNVDGYRLSGYFYKDRSDRLKQGPFWDCDRCMGTGGTTTPQADNRCFSPRYWRLPASDLNTDNGTDFFGLSNVGVSWFERLFRDPEFWQRFIDRYQMWRTNAYSTNVIFAQIDQYYNEIKEAQVREQARWAPSGFNFPRSGSQSVYGYTFDFGPADNFGRGRFTNEVNFQKKWFVDRLEFMDTNFLSMPILSSGTALVPSGATITVTPAAKTNTLLLYTLDGTDPRLRGGAVSPLAKTNSGTLTLTVTNNVRLFVRCYNTKHSNMTNSGPEVGKPLINSFWSGPAVATYYTTLPTLRITEIMYNPAAPPAGNTNNNDNFEFIEFTNMGTNALSLVGFHFTTTNGIDFTFTATNNLTSLAPGGRALLVANSNAFVSRYPGLGGLVAGEYGGRLSNGGGRLTLSGPLAEPILDFSYDNNWYPLTEGRGFSLVPVDETAPASAWNNVTQWRQSTYDGGSPGTPDPTVVTALPVLVNEVMSHAIPPAGDAIELFNPNPANVDISYWYLSDNLNIPMKYRIPNGTVIPAFGFVVFYETNSFGVAGALQPFGLSANGESAYVFSGDSTGHLTGYYHGHNFGASALGVTFGRYINSVGNVDFVAQSTNSLGFTNAYPLVGPVVISEIMYDPPNLAVAGVPTDNVRDEFIELRNITNAPVPLYDPLYPTNTWQIRNGVSFDFPPGVVLPSNGYVLVVSFDPNQELASLAAFQGRYGLSNNVPIYGPYSGKLGNTGNQIELRQPGTPNPTTGVPPEIEIDRVEYSSLPPWPTNGIGVGASLQRLNLAGYGNDPTNWVSAGPTAGSDFVAGPPPIISAQPQPQSKLQGTSASFSVGVTGPGPFTYQWLLNGMAVDGAFSQTLVLNNVQPSQAGAYSVVVFSPGGMATSASATLTVFALPVIVQAPTNQSVYAGASVTFRVTATGTGSVGYQWQFNATNILGATNFSLTLTNVQLGTNDGSYTVIVTDTIGSVSATATLLVLVRPVITQHPIPVNQVVAVGGTASFFVSARGNIPMGFRWIQNDVLPGRTNIVLNSNACVFTLSNVSSNDQGSYKVAITNIAGNAGVYTSYAFLTVLYPPSIVLPPTNQITTPCSNATFIVAAAGGLLGYQWYFNATNVLAGATNSTLVITNPILSNIGNYSVAVSNALGVVTSTAASLTILWGDCDSNGLPDLWELTYFGHLGVDPNADPDADGMLNWQESVAGTDPLDSHSYLKWDTLAVSNAASLSFLAVSNRTYSVLWKESLTAGQWTKLFDVDSSATNRVVMINDPLPPAEGRIYRLVVPQLPGPTNPMPAILTSPKSASADLGGPASFNVFAVGHVSPSYQWFFNSNLLAGISGATYNLPAVQDTNVGAYQVTVTDASASATSGPALLVLKPWILTQPQSQSAGIGGSVSFSVTAMGTGPLSYRWRHEGQSMAGQTNSVLTLNGVQSADAGKYSALICQLTPLGTVTTESTNAVLTVVEGP